jgi:hypothetical protein
MPVPAVTTLDTMKMIHGILKQLQLTSVTDELAARFAKHGGHDATLVAEALYLDKTIVTLCNLYEQEGDEAYRVATEMRVKYMTRMDEYRQRVSPDRAKLHRGLPTGRANGFDDESVPRAMADELVAMTPLDEMKLIHSILKQFTTTALTDELAARFAKHGGHDATLVAEALYLDETTVTLCNLYEQGAEGDGADEAYRVATEMRVKYMKREYRVDEALYFIRTPPTMRRAVSARTAE